MALMAEKSIGASKILGPRRGEMQDNFPVPPNLHVVGNGQRAEWQDGPAKEYRDGIVQNVP